jgi:spore coat polysaccharide biosynthesis protein SpsF
MTCRAFIQARMSSRRFPGKVLAPYRGRPLIDHVVEAVRTALPEVPCVVITSVDPTDAPLASYLSSVGVDVFRGPLENVFARFRAALADYPCDGVYRFCADSPMLNGDVIRAVSAHSSEGWDLVTTIFPRTFPKGHNAELIRVATFSTIPMDTLSAEEREHPTQAFYGHPQRYRILNVESGNPHLAQTSFCVDSVEDLTRLEKSERATPPADPTAILTPK